MSSPGRVAATSEKGVIKNVYLYANMIGLKCRINLLPVTYRGKSHLTWLLILERILCVLRFGSNFIDLSIVFDIYSHFFVKRAFAICFSTCSLTK